MFCSIAAMGSLALVLLAEPGAAAEPKAPDASLSAEELLQRLGALQGLSARYREEKTMALLAAPLVSTGVLYFAPPGRLARHQEQPSRASVVIDGNDMRFGDATGTERIDLQRNPVVRLFVHTFVQILAGDQETLTTLYRIEHQPGEGGAWSMTLHPIVTPIDQIIERIVLEGEGVVLSSMEVVEVGGDRTRTTFERVQTDRTFTDAELQRLFRIPR